MLCFLAAFIEMLLAEAFVYGTQNVMLCHIFSAGGRTSGGERHGDVGVRQII